MKKSLKKKLKELGISKAALARAAGICAFTLDKVLSHKPTRAQTKFKVLEAFIELKQKKGKVSNVSKSRKKKSKT